MSTPITWFDRWAWPLGLVAFFLAVFAANAAMIWIAVSDADAVVESYDLGPR